MAGGALFLLLLIALGVVLVALGLRGRRVSDHPHCRRCGFDLVGAETRAQSAVCPSPLCPECGAMLDARVPGARPRPIKRGRRQRRRHLVAVGAILLVLSALPLALTQTGAWTRYNASKPAWVLHADIRIGSPAVRSAALAEFERRILDDTLSPGQARRLAELALRVQADRSRPWDPAWGDVIVAADEMGHTGPEVFLAYSREGAESMLRLAERVVWVRDDDLGVLHFPHPQPRFDSTRDQPRLGSSPGATVICAVEMLDATLDGEPLGVYDLTSELARQRARYGETGVSLPMYVLGPTRSMTTLSPIKIEARERQLIPPIRVRGGKPSTRPDGILLEETSPGQHELTVRWRLHLLRDQSLTELLGTHDVELATTFEIVTDVNELYGGTVTREEATPEQYGAMRWLMDVERVEYSFDGLRPLVNLELARPAVVGRAIPFTLSARIELEVGGRRWPLKRAFSNDDGAILEPVRFGRTPSSAYGFQPDYGLLDKPLPPGTDRVNVILSPDVAAAAKSAAADRQFRIQAHRRWASEIVIEDVPVVTEE